MFIKKIIAEEHMVLLRTLQPKPLSKLLVC
jgi:hypothetical protein